MNTRPNQHMTHPDPKPACSPIERGARAMCNARHGEGYFERLSAATQRQHVIAFKVGLKVWLDMEHGTKKMLPTPPAATEAV